MVGRFAIPFQSSYTATKFALSGFSQALRSEVRSHGIRVVVIEPNDVRTAIEPRIFSAAGSVYARAVGRMRKIRDSRMAEAPGPAMVAEKVAEVLEDPDPDPFYVVGGAGPLLAFLKRLLPDVLVERLVRRSYGLE
jgi:NAD(P)-dependent dehydrogenase (short-subunit alcohol dehydrogenase family)